MLKALYDRWAWPPLSHGNALLSSGLAAHRPCSNPADVAGVDWCQEWAAHCRKTLLSGAAQEAMEGHIAGRHLLRRTCCCKE